MKKRSGITPLIACFTYLIDCKHVLGSSFNGEKDIEETSSKNPSLNGFGKPSQNIYDGVYGYQERKTYSMMR
jgi:hypothetical protein